VKLLSDFLNVCDHNPPTLLTDRQTSRTHRRRRHSDINIALRK